MKKLKHTKGKWTHSKGFIGAKQADFVSCDRINYDGMHIHNGEKTFGVSSKESEANARLIAVAPEMLEVLINVAKYARAKGMTSEMVDEVIKKATGIDAAKLI